MLATHFLTIAESQCGRRFPDEAKIQRHADIFCFLRDTQQWENTKKDISNIESASPFKTIVNKMDTLEIDITSAEEKLESQLQYLEEEHMEKIEDLKRKLNNKREELAACIHVVYG